MPAIEKSSFWIVQRPGCQQNPTLSKTNVRNREQLWRNFRCNIFSCAMILRQPFNQNENFLGTLIAVLLQSERTSCGCHLGPLLSVRKCLDTAD
jgi:hypothetical protein